MRTLFTEKSTKTQSAGHCIRAYCSLLRVQLLNCLLRYCVLKYYPLLCCLLFCCQLSTAQSFPVQVIAQATPPAPTNFSDFANTSALNGPLRVQLVLNDFQISDRQVRLQVTFNGNGIGFQSNENVIGATPLFLEGGIPTVLDHTLLAPYFEFDNLTGIPPNVYGSPIPDGVYQVCFQVFDVLTGKRLSNNACTTINVFKNSPPILVLPENGSDIVERSPQNIMFQWTPRHINVSQVEYELSLVEIWDNAMDPQAAFLGSTPLFTATTSATTYVYGPGDPMLLPNRTYAWRVQARPKPGAGEVGGFLNQGYSQIFSFTHIEGCYVPNGIYHEVRGANQANIFWEDNSTSVPQFRVRYRTQGNGNAWFYNQTTANWTTLWDLQAGTTYEYQLKKTCAVAESDWSPLRQFTTNLETEEEDLYQCGVSPDVGITNQDPLPQLSVGESFTAGDFQVVATEVHGGNGYFTGRGHTRLPYLSNIKLAVHFTNILVNTDRQLAQGTVITAFDPTMRNIVNTGEVVQTVGELGEAVGDLLEELFSQKEELLNQLAEAESFEEQQGFISQINDLEVTIDQQIDQIPNKENLPQELQDELQELKQEGSIVANNVLTPQEIADISTADAARRDRIKEIAAIAESGELDMVSDKIWFMPDWTPFKLAEDVSNTILQDGPQTIVGTVHGLKYNGTDYFARFSSDGKFEGYYIENTDDKADIPDWENVNEEAEVYLYQYLPNECNAIFKTSFGYVDSLRSNIPYTQDNENLTRVYISNCEDEDNVYDQIEQPNSIIVNVDGQSELITAAKQNQETPDEAFALNVRILDFAGITSASEKQELAQQMGSTRILEGTLMHYILTDNNTQPSLINEFLELVPDSGTYYRWIHFEDSGRVIINDKVPAGFDEALERAAYHWTQDYWDNLELNSNRGTRDFLFSYMLQTNMMLSIMADLLAEVQIAEKYWNAGDQANYMEQMEYVARWFALLNGQTLSVFNAEQAQLQFAFYCGIFNGLMEELTGVVQLGELLTEYVTNVDSARTFDEGLNNIDLVTIWSQFQTAHGLDGNGGLNQYVLAHQLGKDLVFVASLFIGIEEVTSVSKAGQVLRNLENLADLAKLKKARRLKNLYPDGWNKLKTLTPLPDNFWSKLDELGEAQGRFLADFDAQQLQLFVENPNLVDSWRLLDDAGVDAALRKDPSWLNRVSGWTDEGLEVASEGRILKEGSEVGRIVGDRLNVKYTGHGGDIVCDPDKTTTLLGKWKDPAGGGTSDIIDSKLSKSGQNKGGANVLSEDIPDGWTDQQIWDNVNEPWLRDAANRGDVIRVVSDPNVPTNIYKPDGTLSFFGREHEILTKPVSQGGLGYTYNPSTFTYTK